MNTHKESNGNDVSFTFGSSIVAEKINVTKGNAQYVEVVDLIEFMQQQNGKIDLVKLDVEGAEIEILHRIIATEAWHLFDRMYVETHETKIPSHVHQLQLIK